MLPTFAELAGAPAPTGLDGVSIVPTLTGGSQPAHPLLYWTWPGLGETAPLPLGWRAEQDAAGILVFVHEASGAVQALHPALSAAAGSAPAALPAAALPAAALPAAALASAALASAVGEVVEDVAMLETGAAMTADAARAVGAVNASAKKAGFAVVSGDWKGIVPKCGALEPSEDDLQSMLVFHLPTDWPEKNNLAGTAAGQDQAKRLLGLVLDAKLSCGCYQC